MINKLKSKLPEKGGFVFNTLVLMTGTTIAQAIPIAISPILTRIYSPENFGIFALFTSITGILSTIATGRYELAIMLPEKDEDSINVVALSILIAFGISFLILSTVFIFNNQITKLLGNQEISKWLYFVPLFVLLAGIYQSLKYWATRKKQFKKVAISEVSQSTARATINTPLGFLNFGSTGLITGALVGQASATSVLGWKTWKNDKSKRRFISKEKIKKNARIYKNFPKYSTLKALLNTASNQMPIFLLTSFFSATITGFYSFGHRIVAAPMGLLGRSVAQVFYEKASRTYNEQGDLYNLVKNVYIKLAKIGIIPFTLLIVLAPTLFAIIFGSEWKQAGIYTQILTPWLFVMFLNSPVTFVVEILGKQKEYLIYEVFLFLFRVVSIMLGFYIFNNSFVSIVLFSSISTIFSIFLLFYFLHISKKAYINNTI